MKKRASTPLLASVISTLIAPTTGWGCGPFDMSVQTKLNGSLRSAMTKGASVATDSMRIPEKLKFASKVIKDARMVHSDAPFMMIPEHNIQWKLSWYPNRSVSDTRLASENTMLEFAGYFRDSIKIRDLQTREFLTNKVMTQFNEVSAMGLRLYPTSTGQVNERIEAAVRSTFENADAVLNRMRTYNRSSAQYGLQYFTRPAYLSSKKIKQKHGDSLLLSCMMLAYGVDLYTNTRVPRSRLVDITRQTLRSSIIDWMAGKALEVAKKGSDVNQLKVTLADGNIQCRLKPAKSFYLEPVDTHQARPRCGPGIPIRQPAAVVRRGPNRARDQRFIQVRNELFTTHCRVQGQADWLDWIDIADWSAANYSTLDRFVGHIARTAKSQSKNSKLGQLITQNANYLIQPTQNWASQKFAQQGAKLCDEKVTGFYKNDNPIDDLLRHPPVGGTPLDLYNQPVVKPTHDDRSSGLGRIRKR